MDRQGSYLHKQTNILTNRGTTGSDTCTNIQRCTDKQLAGQMDREEGQVVRKWTDRHIDKLYLDKEMDRNVDR
jgi:hypothetical protein